MKSVSLLSVSLLSVSLLAQEVPAGGQAAAPAVPAPAANPAAAKLFQNPDAWIVPENFVAVVCEGDLVDAAWLEKALDIQSSATRFRFEKFTIDMADDASLSALVARARAAAGEHGRAVVVLSRDFPEAVLTSPSSGWAVMNPDWVLKAESPDQKTTEARFGKLFCRAIGASLGLGSSVEAKSPLRSIREPADLDASQFQVLLPRDLMMAAGIAKTLGIERKRMKPRAELEKMGLVPAKKPADGEGPSPKAEAGQ